MVLLSMVELHLQLLYLPCRSQPHKSQLLAKLSFTRSVRLLSAPAPRKADDSNRTRTSSLRKFLFQKWARTKY